MTKFKIELEVDLPETWTKKEVEQRMLERVYGFGGIRRDQIKVINLGTFHKKVRLVPLNDSQNTKEIDFTYIDTKIKPGLNPYWIKIIQWNGEIAWSSPIFIRYKNSTNKQI